jgi:fluoride exporter
VWTRHLLLFVAGGTGAVLRVWLAQAVDARWEARWPGAGTLLVNVIGSFVIGIVAAAMAPGLWRTTIAAGLLGGFTTYSAFSLLVVELSRSDRIGVAALQIGAHLVFGVLAVILGFWLARALIGLGAG